MNPVTAVEEQALDAYSNAISQVAERNSPSVVSRLPVREVRASVGAGFIYPICGDMRTMPGLASSRRR